MRCLLVALIFISLWALFSELRAESSTACPVTTQVESTAIARAWHDDVINRRNPTKLSDIVGPEVVHHAAGGYPKIMNAEGIAAMMGDFLTAFPDLLITFDQFIANDDFVVERYTASGTPGTARRLATHQSHSHLDWYQYISHWLRTHCRSLVRG